MSSSSNWQCQIKFSGHSCYVAVKRLDGGQGWGRIGETQVTQAGLPTPRPVFPREKWPKTPKNPLLRLSLLKCSLSGTRLIRSFRKQDETLMNYHELDLERQLRRSTFFSKLKQCTGAATGSWGHDIIIGPNHSFYSAIDESDKQEQSGNYKAQKPKPSPFMLNVHGNAVPWVAGPLSDHRSIGDWVVEYHRFFINDGLDDDDEDVNSVPTTIIINRVGQYFFYT